ncbi:DMT family transporter [Streptomyces sp. ATCC 21386]|uniref:DMT family transporter n=1 Tax=Streptomyces sp. ATCC 21386 TaxID=2699428 RepID=UPI002044DA75|nr:DMT family transporter [Streptomyces sp. ATCC 21386]
MPGRLPLPGSVVAYTMFFVGLGAVRATTASVVALVEPLTAAVIGVLVFGERLNAIILTGTTLLLFAVLFLAADEGAGRAASRRTPGADHDQRAASVRMRSASAGVRLAAWLPSARWSYPPDEDGGRRAGRAGLPPGRQP